MGKRVCIATRGAHRNELRFEAPPKGPDANDVEKYEARTVIPDTESLVLPGHTPGRFHQQCFDTDTAWRSSVITFRIQEPSYQMLPFNPSRLTVTRVLRAYKWRDGNGTGGRGRKKSPGSIE